MDFRTKTLPTLLGASAHRAPLSGRTICKRGLTVAAVVLLLLLATGAALLAAKWPFTPEKMTAQLGEATSGSVQIHGFRTTYFPPGCVMEGLELRQPGHSSGPPLLTGSQVNDSGELSRAIS